MPVHQLGELVKGLGFDGIELPVRQGCQVEPADAEKGLPALVDIMKEYGIKVTSIAGDTEENIFSACAEAGVPVIRIMAGVDLKEGYMASIEKFKRKLDGLLPLCEKYHVTVGIQNHFGAMVSNSMELRDLVGEFDPGHIAGIWDAAHSALAGEEPEQGLDIIWSHLNMVNLKNAYYYRVDGPEAANGNWKRYFTTAKDGMASWTRIAGYLKQRGYSGVLCLTAEYTAKEEVNKLAAFDIEYARTVFDW